MSSLCLSELIRHVLITLIQTSPACPEGKEREGCNKRWLLHNSCVRAESTCLDTAFREVYKHCSFHPTARLSPTHCLVNVQKALLVHLALGVMIDTGSPLQRASWLVPSHLCGPEHITGLGMTPCCLVTTSLGPRWHPLSHWDDVALAASSHGAAPGAASHTASCHTPLFTRTCLLHIHKVSRGQLGQTGSTWNLQCELNQVRKSQLAPYTYLAMGAGK